MQRAITLFLLCSSTPALACGNSMVESQSSPVDFVVPLALAGAAIAMLMFAVVAVLTLGMFMMARRA